MMLKLSAEEEARLDAEPVLCRGCGVIIPKLEGPLIVDVGGFRHLVDAYCRGCVAAGVCEWRGEGWDRTVSNGKTGAAGWIADRPAAPDDHPQRKEEADDIFSATNT